MKTNSKRNFIEPELKTLGSIDEITQQSGSGGIDGIIGIDIDGDGNVDIGTGISIGNNIS